MFLCVFRVCLRCGLNNGGTPVWSHDYLIVGRFVVAIALTPVPANQASHSKRRAKKKPRSRRQYWDCSVCVFANLGLCVTMASAYSKRRPLCRVEWQYLAMARSRKNMLHTISISKCHLEIRSHPSESSVFPPPHVNVFRTIGKSNDKKKKRSCLDMTINVSLPNGDVAPIAWMCALCTYRYAVCGVCLPAGIINHGALKGNAQCEQIMRTLW